jgi:hypothetical protein
MGWMIGFIDTPFGTTCNYGAIVDLHTLQINKSSQSSLVVFWQRINNSLTVTAAHSEVFFAQPNSFFAIILPNANSGDSLIFIPKLIFWQAGVSKLN